MSDVDQHSHHCIGKQPDTTRTYPTLPLKLDPKFIVPPPALFGHHNNGEQKHNWAKKRISKYCKITPVQKQRAHELLKQSEITFSVEIIVKQDKLIFHPQVESKQMHYPSFVKKYTIYLIDTQKTPQAILSSIIHTLDSPTYVHKKFNSHVF